MDKNPPDPTAGLVRVGATGIDLDDAAYARVLAAVPWVADEAVSTIMAEVPAYAGAFSGDLGVRFSAMPSAWPSSGSSTWPGRAQHADPSMPIAPSTEGAYELGRGEARSGRGMDALLAASGSGLGCPGGGCRGRRSPPGCPRRR